MCSVCEWDLSPKHATTKVAMKCDVCSEVIPVGASVVHWLTKTWTRAVICAVCAKETGMTVKADAFHARWEARFKEKP